MTLRDNIRNYLYPMTFEEMEKEHQISIERGDTERAELIREYIAECWKKGEFISSLTPDRIDRILKGIQSDEPGEVYGTVEIDDELRKDSPGDSPTNL